MALPPTETRRASPFQTDTRHFKLTVWPDTSRVSLSGAWEADYWTHEVSVSHGELINIVAKVGNSVTAVRKELGLAAAPMKIVRFT